MKKEVRKLTAALTRADARRVVAYLDFQSAQGWIGVRGLVVGPVGFTLHTAVEAAHPGKWPNRKENGHYDIPNALQVARGLRKGLDLLKPSGPRFPEGGTPGAGAGEIYEIAPRVANARS